jgi:Ca2+-binding RTX toxin-like protein
MTRRTLIFASACILLVITFASLAVTNTLTVPDSVLDSNSEIPTANQLAPAACTVSLNNVVTYSDGGAGNDLVAGSAGNDTLNGNAGDDCVVGGGGNDTLNGNADNDVILGGDGDDILDGGDGDDTIDGGPGTDVCTGGLGTDTFLNCETINDP